MILISFSYPSNTFLGGGAYSWNSWKVCHLVFLVAWYDLPHVCLFGCSPIALPVLGWSVCGVCRSPYLILIMYLAQNGAYWVYNKFTVGLCCLVSSRIFVWIILLFNFTNFYLLFCPLWRGLFFALFNPF